MGFFGKLFGSDAAVSSLIDGAKSGLDKLWYTDEEKAEDRAKSSSEARSMVIDWLRNTQGQSLSRRLISLSITFVWLLLHIISALLSIAAVWVEDSERFILSSNIVSETASNMVPAVMLILGFYFAAPHMGNIAQAALIKFGDANTKKETIK